LDRQKKEREIAALREKFEKAESVILADYRGLKVSDINGLRSQMKESQAEFRVAKNTLLKMAIKESNFAPLKDYLTGPTGVAYSYEDVSALAKLMKIFSKTHPNLEIKAGVIQGKLHTPEEVFKIADLPTRPEMLSMLLSALQGVPRSLVNVLSGVPRNFIQVLVAIKDQKDAA
jgi:large subunit ribosomal protein L10